MKGIITNTVIAIFLSVTICAQRQEQIVESGKDHHLAKTIVIKLKEDTFLNNNKEAITAHLNDKLEQPIVEKLSKVFPQSKKLLKGADPLQRIFYLTVNSENMDDVIKRLTNLPDVEWAELKYVRKLCYDPNDEFYLSGKQTYLNVIQAKEAWDITKGSKDVVIGIIDTGVDIDHPDLSANIYINTNEIPGNGIDEDDSGEYVDDVNGWDFGGLNGIPDNDPREDRAYNNGYHGTHVAGIASAVTDNNYGVASIGFNCKILPVKVSQDSYRDENDKPYITYGFEGIKYAVDKGVKIISCSWGGYEYSKFEKEIIDYAVSNGVLIVAAAGNNNTREPFYPASYDGVFSVGWTNNDDTKSIAGNYGEFIDAMAPGTAIYSTWPSISGYLPPFNYAGGSSMSAPLTAGLAGLVLSKFPNLTAEQIAERIRVTCDKIDQKNLFIYNNLLGSGRINAFRAVADSNVYSLRATEINFVNHVGTAADTDTTAIEITFKNYLLPIANATVTISSNETFVKFIKNKFETVVLGEMEAVQTSDRDFLFTLSEDAPTDTTIYFLLEYEIAGDFDFQWIPVNINPSYKTHNNGKIIATVTSKGGLGFSDFNSNYKGEGFKYFSGYNLLYEGGLLFGVSPNKLVDGARIKFEQSNDLKVLKSITISENGAVNSSYSLFNDDNAGSSKLGIITHSFCYSFNSAPDDSYIILHFVLENTTQEKIQGLFLGYLLDWNTSPNDYLNDTTAFDRADNFAYAFNKKQNSTYVGASLLSSQSPGYMGVNNRWRVGEVIFEDGFDDGEKWYSISNGIIDSGVSGDISFVISGGPVDINAGAREKFTFSVAAAHDKEELRQVINQSREKYISFISDVEIENNSMPEDFTLYQNYPNPFNPTTIIEYEIPTPPLSKGRDMGGVVTLKVYDILGREVVTLVNEYQPPGNYSVEFDVETFHGTSLPSGVSTKGGYASGVYFYRLTIGNKSQTRKMLLLK
ncbi:MAG: S8 family serine peptidase [Bacteroidota bacterium]